MQQSIFIRRGIGYDDYIADYADYRNVNKEDLYDVADEILSNAKGYRTLEEWYTHIENYKKELEELAKRGNRMKMRWFLQRCTVRRDSNLKKCF